MNKLDESNTNNLATEESIYKDANSYEAQIFRWS